MRALILALLLLAPLPLLAQSQAQAPQVAVNGQLLPATAVLGPAGDDLMVLASPYLEALGGSVRRSPGHIEAWFPEGVLSLSAGTDTYSWSGHPGRLSEPVGSLGEEDLVVKVREIAAVLKAQVTPTVWGMEVARQGATAAAADPNAQYPMPPTVHDPTGGMTSSVAQGTDKPYQSPYQRPAVETASATVATPTPGASPKPARAVVSDLKARRIMSFHLTNYEVVAKVRNEGTVAMPGAVQVQLLARGERNDSFELLEAFLVRALGPGEEVELKKTVDGNQFHSLQGMSVTFRAQVILDAAPVTSSTSSSKSASREGDSREYRCTY